MEELMSFGERKTRTSPRVNVLNMVIAKITEANEDSNDPAVASVLGYLVSEFEAMKEKIENGEETSEDSGEYKPRGRKPALNEDGTRVHPILPKGPSYVVYDGSDYGIVQTDKAPTSDNLGSCERAWGPFPRRTSAEKAMGDLDAHAEKRLF
jgi:hypothetical protein